MNADDFEEQMHRQNQLLSSVPSIFFQEEFDLTSREAFEEILPCLVSDLVGESNNNNNDKTSLDDDNMANSAVLAQEQLGQYLDLVESVIMKRVGDRAEVFLEAMAKTKKLQETIEETKKSVVDLRTNNRRSFRRAAHATAKVKEMSRRRDNILWLAETLKDIENIRQTKLDVDVLLESGEYSECLEAIDECERSLRVAIERATKNNSRGGSRGRERIDHCLLQAIKTWILVIVAVVKVTRQRRRQKTSFRVSVIFRKIWRLQRENARVQLQQSCALELASNRTS